MGGSCLSLHDENYTRCSCTALKLAQALHLSGLRDRDYLTWTGYRLIKSVSISVNPSSTLGTSCFSIYRTLDFNRKVFANGALLSPTKNWVSRVIQSPTFSHYLRDNSNETIFCLCLNSFNPSNIIIGCDLALMVIVSAVVRLVRRGCGCFSGTESVF